MSGTTTGTFSWWKCVNRQELLQQQQKSVAWVCEPPCVRQNFAFKEWWLAWRWLYCSYVNLELVWLAPCTGAEVWTTFCNDSLNCISAFNPHRPKHHSSRERLVELGVEVYLTSKTYAAITCKGLEYAPFAFLWQASRPLGRKLFFLSLSVYQYRRFSSSFLWRVCGDTWFLRLKVVCSTLLWDSFFSIWLEIFSVRFVCDIWWSATLYRYNILNERFSCPKS